MTASEKLKQISLRFSGMEAPAREAEILVTEALGISRSKLHTSTIEITHEDSEHIDLLAARRLKGEPMSYLLGHVGFSGLDIRVGKGVLIPRPETELMVEEAEKLIKTALNDQRPACSGRHAAQSGSSGHGPGLTILDLCTGSGCIALALASILPQAVVYGMDKSGIALSYAAKNAEINGIKNVQFAKGNLFGPIGDCLFFDCIISNPPYIRHSDIDALQVEIRDYEPREALDGGEDGLDFYRRILRDAPRFLKTGGLLILEIGADQANDIRQLAGDAGFRDIGFIKDYAGIERIFTGKK